MQLRRGAAREAPSRLTLEFCQHTRQMNAARRAIVRRVFLPRLGPPRAALFLLVAHRVPPSGMASKPVTPWNRSDSAAFSSVGAAEPRHRLNRGTAGCARIGARDTAREQGNI